MFSIVQITSGDACVENEILQVNFFLCKIRASTIERNRQRERERLAKNAIFYLVCHATTMTTDRFVPCFGDHRIKQPFCLFRFGQKRPK